jgi:peptide/nickel transport system substrate-binding protein
MRKRKVAFAARLGLAFGLLATVALLPQAGSTATRPLVINLGCSPQSFDPGALTSDTCAVIQWELYPTLVAFGSKPGPFAGTQVWDRTQVLPVVAQSWTVSPNGRVYTFHLNPSAKFPDGTQITSDIVKYNFDRDHATGGTANYFLGVGEADNFPVITTPDPETVVATLPTRPNSDLLNGFAADSLLVEPSIIAQHPDTKGSKGTLIPNDYWGTHIAGGGGPFNLVSYTPGQQLTLARNPDYVGPKVPVDSIVLNFNVSESARVLQARSGQADITLQLSNVAANSLKGSPNARVLLFPTSNWIDLGLVWSHPPFNNVYVRQAVTHAIPFQSILTSIGKGQGRLFYGPIPPGFSGYNPALEDKVPAYDLTLAKQLMAKSGVKTPVTVRLAIVQGDTVGTQIATVLQGIWKQLGLNIQLEVQPSAQFNSTVFAGKDDESYTFTDGAAVGTPAGLLSFDMLCNVQFNISFICMHDADKLFNKVRVLPASQQTPYWNQLIKIWQANAAKVPLYTLDIPVVLSKRVNNFFFYSSLYYFYPDSVSS